MIHKMKLRPEPFAKIAAGEKSFELRLWDEKRSLIKAGELIEFSRTDNGEKLLCRVLALHRFESFDRLWHCLPREKLGITSPGGMEKYYSPAQQAQYGVVGIEIKTISQPFTPSPG